MNFLRTTEFAFFMHNQRSQIRSDCLHFFTIFLQTFPIWVVPCASRHPAKVEKKTKILRFITFSAYLNILPRHTSY